jgi:autotransporter-associated beta strand protein
LISNADTTLVLADSETIRSLTGGGTVDLGSAVLTLSGDDDATFSGVVGGAGGLVKLGDGAFTIAGANTYTGGTRVLGGTLAFGEGGSLSDAGLVDIGQSAVVDLSNSHQTIGGLAGDGKMALGAAQLTIEQATNTAFSGIITGSGGLTKRGGGRLDLVGHSSFSGATTIESGTLAVMGSLASSVMVASSGRLSGSGSVGGLSVLSGGVFAPGDGLGSTQVAGTLSFAAGSIFEVDVTPRAADRTNVLGPITINGGIVQVRASGTPFDPLTRFTILQSGGSVSGTFAGVTSDLAFLTPSLEYRARDVILALRRNDIEFGKAASTANQLAVANTLQTLGSNPLFDAVLVQSAAGARLAFDALSGEILASTGAAVLARAAVLQNAMGNHRIQSDGVAVWAEAARSDGRFEERVEGSASFRSNADYLLGGLQWRRGNLATMLAVGQVIDDLVMPERESEAQIESFIIGGEFVFGEVRGVRVAGGADYAMHEVDTNRSTFFPGFAEQITSSRDGEGFSIWGEVAHVTKLKGVTTEPFAALSYNRVSLDAVRETGGSTALETRSSKLDPLTALLGVRLSSALALGRATLTPRAELGWQRRFGTVQGMLDAALVSGGSGFTINGAAVPRSAAKVGLKAELDLRRALVSVGFDATVGSSADQVSARASVAVPF